MSQAARDELTRQLMTNEGMERFLNDLLGVGQWVYDADEDVWVSPNSKHTGTGKGYIVVQRGGSWSTAVVPEDHSQ